MGAFPGGVRRILQPPPGGSEEAQGRVVPEPGAERSAVRGGRAAGPVQRLGTHGSTVQALAVPVEGRRPRATGEIGGGLAAVQNRLRRLLRALQAQGPDRHPGESGGPHDGDPRPRGHGGGGRRRRRTRAREAVRARAKGAGGMAAGPRGAAHAAAGSRSAIPRRAGADRLAVAGRLRGNRPRPRANPQAHGEAARARRAVVVDAAGRVASRVAGGAAGHEMARAPGIQHHVRRPVQAGRRGQVARGRTGSAQRATAVDAPWARARNGGRSAQRALSACLPHVL